MVSNGLTDGDRSVIRATVLSLAVLASCRVELGGFGVLQHDATTISIHPIENQIQNAFQNFIEVLGPAQGEGGLIDNFQRLIGLRRFEQRRDLIGATWV